MKFGGTSVADLDHGSRNVAQRVKRADRHGGDQVAVVVSAMAGKTNQLVDWTREMAAWTMRANTTWWSPRASR